MELPRDPRQMGALELAFIGDAAFELYVRVRIAASCGGKSGALHSRSVAIVRAGAQAAAARVIMDKLNEGEREVFLRGRNAKPRHTPRGASGAEYALATGLEALFGFLYLSGETARLNELMTLAYEAI